MFSNTARPSSIAATMLAKLSSSRIRSAASLATSVPLMPMAMPMSAVFSAGASLTPSPVTATISPLFFSASTMRIFCSAATRAKRISGASSASCSCVGDISRSCSPLITSGASPRTRPIWRAIARPVCGWSPVTMMIRMPASSQRAIASGTSGRGGSSRPISPARIIPCSSPGTPVSSTARWAKARTRSPHSPSRPAPPAGGCGRLGSSGATPASNSMKRQPASTVSRAPLQ
jgi:hypothetical protein